MQRLLATAAAVTAALVVVPPAIGAGAGHHGSGAQRGNADAGLAGAAAQREPARRAVDVDRQQQLVHAGRADRASTSPRPTTSAVTKLAVLDRQRRELHRHPDHGGPVGHGHRVDHPAGQHHGPLPRDRRGRATPRAASPPTPRSTRRRPSAPPPSGSRARTAAPPATSSSSTPATTPETVKIASTRHARSRRAGARTSTLAVAADEGARRRHRRPGLPAVPHDRRADRHPAADRGAAGHGRQQPHRPQPRSITPTRTDPTPGSGGTAVRDTWLDGTWIYPLPLDASQLSLGKHTWEVGVNDNAGNGNQVKFTFLVTTSFADVDALLTRCGTAGTIPAADVTVAAREAGRGQGRQRRRRRGGRDRPAARPSSSEAARRRQRQGARPADHRRAGAHPRRARAPGRRPSRPTSAPRPRAYAGRAAPPVRAPGDADQQPEREVQGPGHLAALGRLPPPGDRGRPRADPAAGPAARLRRRPVGLQLSGRVAQRHAVHERRRPGQVQGHHRRTRPWA